MSGIGPIGAPSSLPPIGGSDAAGKASGGGFGDALSKGLDSVGNMEKTADDLVSTMAAGGNVQVADIMAATSKANLGMSILNEIRARGLEAYQSIINVQV